MTITSTIISLLLWSVFVGITPGVVNAQAADPGRTDLHISLVEQLGGPAEGKDGEHRVSLHKGLSQVGFLDLGGPSGSIAADLWAHGNFAYVGNHAGANVGVRVIDISDAAKPQLVTELPTPGRAVRARDVMVASVNTMFFHGDLLVAGNAGGPPPGGGIQLWDVSNPRNPVLLSAPRIGSVHTLFLYQRGSRAFVLLAVPFAEVFLGFGDFVVVEVTDPRNPLVRSNWGAGKDGGLAFGSPSFAGISGLPPGADCTPPPGTPPLCRGDVPAPGALPRSVFLHDVWANSNGTVAYLAYWDAGVILLDISDPGRPTFLGRGSQPVTFGSDEGNTHSAVPAEGGNLVVVTNEDFTPYPQGFFWVFDTRDARTPIQIGAYATPGTLTNPRPPNSNAHNIFVRGNRAYIAWSSEGVRVMDLSRPSSPREIAAFIPAPPRTAPVTFWGIFVLRDLILASDFNYGLYILKETGQ